MADADFNEDEPLPSTARATRFSLGSVVVALLAVVTGTITGVLVPLTTVPGGINGELDGWTHRSWTPVTDRTMWIGLAITAVLAITALALGLVARQVRLQRESGFQQNALVLTPKLDLGILLALIAPVAFLVAEAISMTALLLSQ